MNRSTPGLPVHHQLLEFTQTPTHPQTESTYNAGDLGLIPGKIPWRREWQPTSVSLPGEVHGQRSLVSYSPRGHKESDMTG